MLTINFGQHQEIVMPEVCTSHGMFCAMALTLSPPVCCLCRLMDFAVVDSAGQMQTLDRLKLVAGEFTLSGGALAGCW